MMQYKKECDMIFSCKRCHNEMRRTKLFTVKEETKYDNEESDRYICSKCVKISDFSPCISENIKQCVTCKEYKEIWMFLTYDEDNRICDKKKECLDCRFYKENIDRLLEIDKVNCCICNKNCKYTEIFKVRNKVMCKRCIKDIYLKSLEGVDYGREIYLDEIQPAFNIKFNEKECSKCECLYPKWYFTDKECCKCYFVNSLKNYNVAKREEVDNDSKCDEAFFKRSRSPHSLKKEVESNVAPQSLQHHDSSSMSSNKTPSYMSSSESSIAARNTAIIHSLFSSHSQSSSEKTETERCKAFLSNFKHDYDEKLDIENAEYVDCKRCLSCSTKCQKCGEETCIMKMYINNNKCYCIKCASKLYFEKNLEFSSWVPEVEEGKYTKQCKICNRIYSDLCFRDDDCREVGECLVCRNKNILLNEIYKLNREEYVKKKSITVKCCCNSEHVIPITECFGSVRETEKIDYEDNNMYYCFKCVYTIRKYNEKINFKRVFNDETEYGKMCNKCKKKYPHWHYYRERKIEEGKNCIECRNLEKLTKYINKKSERKKFK